MSESQFLKWLIVGSHAIFASILLVSSGQTSRQVGTLRSLVIVLLLNGVYAWCWANHLFLGKVTAVAGSRSIGVNLALCTLLLSRYKAGPPQFCHHSGILESFIVISVCLGSRISDGIFCLVELSIYRHAGFWAALADEQKCVVSTCFPGICFLAHPET